MNKDSFKLLSDSAKLSYVVTKIQCARNAMGVIYDNCGVNVDGDSLEALTDELVKYALMAEDGLFDEIFDGLNDIVNMLENAARKAVVDFSN